MNLIRLSDDIPRQGLNRVFRLDAPHRGGFGARGHVA